MGSYYLIMMSPWAMGIKHISSISFHSVEFLLIVFVHATVVNGKLTRTSVRNNEPKDELPWPIGLSAQQKIEERKFIGMQIKSEVTI